MQILTNDGDIYCGTPEGIVEALRTSARWDAAPTNAAYMLAVAQRMRLWNGATIRTTSAMMFLQDLAEADAICLMED